MVWRRFCVPASVFLNMKFKESSAQIKLLRQNSTIISMDLCALYEKDKE